MQVVLRYREELDLSRLERAFAATARDFVGVHGVLVQIDEHTLGLDLSSEAATMTVGTQVREAPLLDCVEPAASEVGKPVARLHVTQLGMRGTALAFSLSHTVADGYGYFLFLAALAARYRGQPFFTPKCDRDALAIQVPSDLTVSTEPGELAQSGFVLIDSDVRVPLRVEHRELAISQLQEAPRSTQGNYYSSSDFLAAMIWKDMMADESCTQTTLALPVDLRKHRPDTGPLFFGNAIFFAFKTLSMDELRGAPTEQVARGVRAAIEELPKRVDAGIAEIEVLRRQAGLAPLARLRSVRPEGGLAVTNLAKLPMSSLDFGSGPPLSIERTTKPAPHERTCAVFSMGDTLRLLIARP